MDNGRPITFYNWECPIRTDLKVAGDLEYECDWVDDVEKTRMVKLSELEREFVERVILPLRQDGIKVNYYKFLADTNPLILYPATVDSDTKRRQVSRFMTNFSQQLQDKADEISNGVIRVFPFSKILCEFNREYMEVFNRVKYSFALRRDNVPETQYLRKNKFKGELDELLKHTGVNEMDERLIELGIRTISSYASEEYVIRTALSREAWFQNPVAIPNEAMFTFPVLANCYLGNKNRGPWLFVLYEGGRR